MSPHNVADPRRAFARLLPGAPDIARLLDRLADMELQVGRHEAAERLAHRAVELRTIQTIDAQSSLEDDLCPALTRILAQEPTLCWQGWHGTYESSSPLETLRRETLSAYGVGQFRRALMFLARAPHSVSVNYETGCYGWKHVAERWHQTEIDRDLDYYIGTGAFIAACIASGLVVDRQRHATFVSLSEAACAMGGRA